MNKLDDCRTLPVPSSRTGESFTRGISGWKSFRMKVSSSQRLTNKQWIFSYYRGIYIWNYDVLSNYMSEDVWSYWGRKKPNQNINVLHQAVLKSLTERIENSEARSAAKSTNRPVAIPIAAPAADWKTGQNGSTFLERFFLWKISDKQNTWRDVEFHESWSFDSNWFKFINSLHIYIYIHNFGIFRVKTHKKFPRNHI